VNQTPRIVIIDQDTRGAQCLAELLRENFDAGSIVIESDGQDAIDHFEGGPNAALPGLIFTDLGTPRLSGFAVLEWLRSHAGFDSVPVIVLTDSRERSDIVRAYALGANFYMVKPGNLMRLREMVNALCGFWGRCAVPGMKTTRDPFDGAKQRNALPKDWTESEWFNEWLALARHQDLTSLPAYPPARSA
jgi:two-component system, response regulator